MGRGAPRDGDAGVCWARRSGGGSTGGAVSSTGGGDEISLPGGSLWLCGICASSSGVGDFGVGCSSGMKISFS
jgi:hypothetical protein